MESLKELNRLKETFDSLITSNGAKNSIEALDEFNQAKMNIVETTRNTVGKELKSLEELHKCTSVE